MCPWFLHLRPQEGASRRRLRTSDVDVEKMDLGVLDFANISPFFALQKNTSVNDILEKGGDLPEQSPDQGSWNAIKGHYFELIEYCKQMKEQVRVLKKGMEKANTHAKQKGRTAKVNKRVKKSFGQDEAKVAGKQDTTRMSRNGTSSGSSGTGADAIMAQMRITSSPMKAAVGASQRRVTKGGSISQARVARVSSTPGGAAVAPAGAVGKPRAVTMSDGQPDDWVIHTDPGTQRHFWHSKTRKASVWTDPRALNADGQTNADL